jgi:mRNA interferase RelE/StbE
MIWQVKFDDRASKELRKLDQQSQKRILIWIRENLATSESPRRKGKSLKGSMKGLWRYRIGDYRIISQIKDDEVLILIVRVGHRKDIYGDK